MLQLFIRPFLQQSIQIIIISHIVISQLPFLTVAWLPTWGQPANVIDVKLNPLPSTSPTGVDSLAVTTRQPCG